MPQTSASCPTPSPVALGSPPTGSAGARESTCLHRAPPPDGRSAAGRQAQQLRAAGGKSTLNWLERGGSEPSCYARISADAGALCMPALPRKENRYPSVTLTGCIQQRRKLGA